MNNRISKLVQRMQENNLDGVLIGSEANRRYMSGFTGSNAMLYLSSTKQVLITDFRYIEQAKKESPMYEIVDQGAKGLITTALELINEEHAKKIGFESEHITYQTYLLLTQAKQVEWIPTEKLVEPLRQIKDKEEIEKLRIAESIGDKAFTHILSFIREHYKQGVTENEVALQLETIMRQNGASATSFATIVASGEKSALPHAQPGNKKLQKGDLVVMDFGCIYEGYCSDMTRTIVIGEPTKEQQKIYDIVLEAQKAALAAIKPGKTGHEIDKVARDIITNAGYKENFGHGLGHSTGVEIHEAPRFSLLAQTVMQPGMIMTVEPGIYIPGWGGVRIEDLVLVTEEGIENLTHSPKDLIAVI